LSEKEMKRIVSSFGPLTIFQPWYMEPPPFTLEGDYRDAVRVLNPPSHMKPGDGFKGLLSEYRTWIRQHRDKSRAAFLKFGPSPEPEGEATWEIREGLRGISRAERESSRALRESSRALRHKWDEQPALRWHLILHLAREMDEDRREADRMLQELQDKESPIKGLLGEEEVKNPLADLAQFESDLLKTFYPIGPVIEAWWALFGGYLKGDERLLTFSRTVMDYVAEAWDPASRRDEKRALEHLSGKNVILI
jgi:hypothetical protein